MNIQYKNTLFYILLIIFYSLIFILIFGYANFDVNYTDWLMVPHNRTDYGDISINYLNFLAFMNNDMPLPYLDNNAYPFITSVLSIDYVPIIMIPLKFFYKNILHYSGVINLQYVWWYGLFAFILQGILSFEIIKKFANTNNLNATLCSIFFITAPPLLYRFPSNFTLTSHFLILLSFLPFFFNWSNKKNILFYFLLGLISSGIASTFVPIIFINLVGLLILKFIKEKNIKTNIYILLAFILGIILTLKITGGFLEDICPYSPGFRQYSANLNTFINPAIVFNTFQSSLFPYLNNLLLYSWGQCEGFAYLGGGFIVLFIFSLFVLLIKYKPKAIFIYIKEHKTEFIIISIILLITFLWSLSLNVTCSNRLLFSIQIPVEIEKLLSIFRTPGRFIWNNFYIVYFLVMFFVLKNFSARKATIILLVALFLQLFDLHSTLFFFHNEYQTKKVYENPLNNNEQWKDFIQNKQALITPNIDNAMYYDEYFKYISQSKFKKVISKEELIETNNIYLKAMQNDSIYNDFYYYAIYNNIKMNSLIRSRHPRYNGYFLDTNLKGMNGDYIYLFSEEYLKYHPLNINNCFYINDEKGICIK